MVGRNRAAFGEPDQARAGIRKIRRDTRSRHLCGFGFPGQEEGPGQEVAGLEGPLDGVEPQVEPEGHVRALGIGQREDGDIHGGAQRAGAVLHALVQEGGEGHYLGILLRIHRPLGLRTGLGRGLRRLGSESQPGDQRQQGREPHTQRQGREGLAHGTLRKKATDGNGGSSDDTAICTQYIDN